ncbi:hypothetical protein, conserved [Plasmodium gonderi]|uniref:CCR4-NOT transcription complex subunit 4 n=1 Tax=Plasmodium gonderi TaxID=77519 RepID=A0A1Y1JQE1_PLAGO|nr:hypothetical protein, conserved [Plasmodium gonderi]GAW83728.1 hypothetical protein, conserved [Plasmodium gonderi]
MRKGGSTDNRLLRRTFSRSYYYKNGEQTEEASNSSRKINGIPESSASGNGSTSGKNVTTNRKHNTTTSKKNTTTSKKDTTTSKKDTTTSKKDTTTSKKNSTTSKKNSTTSKKNTSTSKKNTMTSASESDAENKLKHLDGKIKEEVQVKEREEGDRDGEGIELFYAEEEGGENKNNKTSKMEKNAKEKTKENFSSQEKEMTIKSEDASTKPSVENNCNNTNRSSANNNNNNSNNSNNNSNNNNNNNNNNNGSNGVGIGGNKHKEGEIQDKNNILCPLCVEVLDETDRNFFPCDCGYQICLWCLYYIRDHMCNKCPACRRSYDEKNFIYNRETHEKLLKKQKNQHKGGNSKTDGNNNNSNNNCTSGTNGACCGAICASTNISCGVNCIMNNMTNNNRQYNNFHNVNSTTAIFRRPEFYKNANIYSIHEYDNLFEIIRGIRVVQRNLVFVIGITSAYAKKNLLKKNEYFGKYGQILNIIVNKSQAYNPHYNGPSFSAYITYSNEKEAINAIYFIDGMILDNKTLKASFGTTKYCAAFLKNMPCTNEDCFYLHALGNAVDSFSKDDIHGPKHIYHDLLYFYFKKLPDRKNDSNNNSYDCSGNIVIKTARKSEDTSAAGVMGVATSITSTPMGIGTPGGGVVNISTTTRPISTTNDKEITDSKKKNDIREEPTNCKKQNSLFSSIQRDTKSNEWKIKNLETAKEIMNKGSDELRTDAKSVKDVKEGITNKTSKDSLPGEEKNKWTLESKFVNLIKNNARAASTSLEDLEEEGEEEEEEEEEGEAQEEEGGEEEEEDEEEKTNTNTKSKKKKKKQKCEESFLSNYQGKVEEEEDHTNIISTQKAKNYRNSVQNSSISKNENINNSSKDNDKDKERYMNKNISKNNSNELEENSYDVDAMSENYPLITDVRFDKDKKKKMKKKAEKKKANEKKKAEEVQADNKKKPIEEVHTKNEKSVAQISKKDSSILQEEHLRDKEGEKETKKQKKKISSSISSGVDNKQIQPEDQVDKPSDGSPKQEEGKSFNNPNEKKQIGEEEVVEVKNKYAKMKFKIGSFFNDLFDTGRKRAPRGGEGGNDTSNAEKKEEKNIPTVTATPNGAATSNATGTAKNEELKNKGEEKNNTAKYSVSKDDDSVNDWKKGDAYVDGDDVPLKQKKVQRYEPKQEQGREKEEMKLKEQDKGREETGRRKNEQNSLKRDMEKEVGEVRTQKVRVHDRSHFPADKADAVIGGDSVRVDATETPRVGSDGGTAKPVGLDAVNANPFESDAVIASPAESEAVMASPIKEVQDDMTKSAKINTQEKGEGKSGYSEKENEGEKLKKHCQEILKNLKRNPDMPLSEGIEKYIANKRTTTKEILHFDELHHIVNNYISERPINMEKKMMKGEKNINKGGDNNSYSLKENKEKNKNNGESDRSNHNNNDIIKDAEIEKKKKDTSKPNEEIQNSEKTQRGLTDEKNQMVSGKEKKKKDIFNIRNMYQREMEGDIMSLIREMMMHRMKSKSKRNKSGSICETSGKIEMGHVDRISQMEDIIEKNALFDDLEIFLKNLCVAKGKAIQNNHNDKDAVYLIEGDERRTNDYLMYTNDEHIFLKSHKGIMEFIFKKDEKRNMKEMNYLHENTFDIYKELILSKNSDLLTANDILFDKMFNEEINFVQQLCKENYLNASGNKAPCRNSKIETTFYEQTNNLNKKCKKKNHTTLPNLWVNFNHSFHANEVNEKVNLSA